MCVRACVSVCEIWKGETSILSRFCYEKLLTLFNGRQPVPDERSLFLFCLLRRAWCSVCSGHRLLVCVSGVEVKEMALVYTNAEFFIVVWLDARKVL